MSLPTLLKTALAVMAGWTLLRLTHRVERLEMATGVWRVQAPSSCAAGCPCQILVEVEQSWPAA
jgi:hypothetical protein